MGLKGLQGGEKRKLGSGAAGWGGETGRGLGGCCETGSLESWRLAGERHPAMVEGRWEDIPIPGRARTKRGKRSVGREVRWEEVPAPGGACGPSPSRGAEGSSGRAGRRRGSEGAPVPRPPRLLSPPRGPLPLLSGGRGGAGSPGLLAAPRPLHSGRALLAAAGAGPGWRRRRRRW